MDPVLSVETEEKTYEIYPFEFTQSMLGKFWHNASKFSNLFNHEIRSDFGRFVGLFVDQDSSKKLSARGLIWFIDKDMKGVFYMTRIDQTTDALVHFAFFRKIPSADKLIKEMVKYVFKEYEFNRLSAELPMYVSPKYYSLIEGCGFKFEGKRRRALEFNGRMFDIKIYGILNEEAFDPAFVYSPKVKANGST